MSSTQTLNSTPIPQCRLRRRSGMRPLDFSAPLLAGEAKHDRIRIKLTARIGYTASEQIAEYLEHIGDRSGTDLSPVFRVQSDRTPHTRTISVTRGWLFSGSGKIWRVGECGGGTATLDLDLELNPTRFLAHHGPTICLDQLAVMSAEEALACNDVNGATAAAAALDPNDNVLVGASRQGGTAFVHRQQWWSRVLDIYLAHVRNLIESRLNPAANSALPAVTITPLGLECVVQAECYWEQETDQARTVVAHVADRLGAAAGQSVLRHHFPGVARVEQAQDLNCISVSLHLSKEVQFVLYAKTADRVRFEIRYLKDVRGNAARDLSGSTDAPALLRASCEDARRRANRVMETLAMMITHSGQFDRRHLITFLRGLLRACDGDHDAADRLMEGLINFGGVSETPAGGIAPRATLQRLVQQGIICRATVRVRGVPRYVLTQPFASVQKRLIANLPNQRLRNLP